MNVQLRRIYFNEGTPASGSGGGTTPTTEAPAAITETAPATPATPAPEYVPAFTPPADVVNDTAADGLPKDPVSREVALKFGAKPKEAAAAPAPDAAVTPPPPPAGAAAPGAETPAAAAADTAAAGLTPADLEIYGPIIARLREAGLTTKEAIEKAVADQDATIANQQREQTQQQVKTTTEQEVARRLQAWGQTEDATLLAIGLNAKIESGELTLEQATAKWEDICAEKSAEMLSAVESEQARAQQQADLGRQAIEQAVSGIVGKSPVLQMKIDPAATMGDGEALLRYLAYAGAQPDALQGVAQQFEQIIRAAEERGAVRAASQYAPATGAGAGRTPAATAAPPVIDGGGGIPPATNKAANGFLAGASDTFTEIMRRSTGNRFGV